MKEITKAQEDVLKAVWQAGNGAVADILELLPEPRPAYNTVATVIKVLERKGYIGHKTYGKTNVYHALVSKKEYANKIVRDAFTGLFNKSINQMVSPFIESNEINLNELEELRQMVEAEINKQKE
ncbi:MAG: BlaI/MecI/CopY family transcriptional regulator [Methanosarcina sp.]